MDVTQLFESRHGVGDTRNQGYQEIKSRIHQELLNRLNLERLAKVRRQDAEPEIRTLIVEMLDRETTSTPLSLYERETLLGYLDYQRATLLWKCAGLGPDDLVRRTVPTSNLSLIGIVRHMTLVEWSWFEERFSGLAVPPPISMEVDRDADFNDLDPARRDEDLAIPADLDYAAVGGDPQVMAATPANIGSEALSAFVFHRAGLPDPVDLLGAMFVIEGLGTRKAAGWAGLLKQHLGLADDQVSFLRYHAAGDDEHFSVLRAALRSGLFGDAAKGFGVERLVREEIERVARRGR